MVLKEAPVDWLLKTGLLGIDEKLALGFFIYFVSLGCIMLYKQMNLFATSVVILASLAYSSIPILSKQVWLTPSYWEYFCAIAFTIVVCMSAWCVFDVEDHVFRHRSMGIIFILSKTSLVLFGFRFWTSFVMLLLIGVNDMVATWYITKKHGESAEVLMRLPALVIGLTVVHLLAIFRQQGRWRILYDTQVSLMTEKNAMESLLSMVCDAVFWLSIDGNVVSRSSRQFDSVMCQEMLDVDISSMMPDDECKKFLCGPSNPPKSSVTLFRTSLTISSAQVLSVELFTVDRRSIIDNPDRFREPLKTCKSSNAMGFLVGLRLCEPFAIEPREAREVDHTPQVAPDDLLRLPTNALHPTTFLSSSHQQPRQRVMFAPDVPEVSDSVSASSRSSSTRGKSILRRTSLNKVQYSMPKGPIHGPPFKQSGRYLDDCSLSLLEDLLSSWNLVVVEGCCAWHACLNHLDLMTQEMRSLHRCSEKWRPEALWQCRNCAAVLGSNHPSDACWLCHEPRQDFGKSMHVD